MNLIKEIREKLGITQEQLGQYLAQSRSAINMSERYERTLPTEAMLKLLRLRDMINEKPKLSMLNSALDAQEVTEHHTKVLKSHAKDCICKIQKIEKEVEKMKYDHHHLNHLKHVTTTLMEELPDDKHGKKDRLWFEILQRSINKRRLNYNSSQQAILHIKINALKHEAESAIQLLQKIEEA